MGGHYPGYSFISVIERQLMGQPRSISIRNWADFKGTTRKELMNFLDRVGQNIQVVVLHVDCWDVNFVSSWMRNQYSFLGQRHCRGNQQAI